MSLQDNVKNAVSKKTHSLDVDDSIHYAMTQMSRHNVSAFIVKSHDTVAGIVCDIDLVKSVINHDDIMKVKVAEVMTVCELISEDGVVNPCAQIDENESVENALKVIDAAGTHNLLISGKSDADAKLVSIVDLLKLAIS